MTYFSELRAQWRWLLAAILGLGTGLSASSFSIGIFGHKLMEEFHWSKAQFALTGMMALANLVWVPVIGRMTDVIGVRRIAWVGVACLPLTYLAFSLQTGNIFLYLAIACLQIVLCLPTTGIVYNRLIAERFQRSRGLALGITSCAPAVFGAAGAPLLVEVVHSYGWRVGYQAMGAFGLVGGVLALIILPRTTDSIRASSTRRAAIADYGEMVQTPAFWWIMIGMFLCNLGQAAHGTQLILVLVSNGLSAALAAQMISLYAIGMIIGRFACGIALDKFPAHIVATIGMGVPSIGLFLLAGHDQAQVIVALSMALIGLSVGAEGDIVSYLVAKHFGVRIFSSVASVISSGISLSAVAGALLLSGTLAATDSYSLFMVLSGFAALAGAGFFLLLRQKPSIAAPVAAATQTENA